MAISRKPPAPAPSSSILEIRDLRIVRDGTRILDGLSWSVNAGEHWVILGSNGSGKTSLLSSLTGYLSLQSQGKVAEASLVATPVKGRERLQRAA